MEEKTIIRVNGVDIVATSDGLIPIRPICEALGISYERQYRKVNESEDLGSVVALRATTGADNIVNTDTFQYNTIDQLISHTSDSVTTSYTYNAQGIRTGPGALVGQKDGKPFIHAHEQDLLHDPHHVGKTADRRFQGEYPDLGLPLAQSGEGRSADHEVFAVLLRVDEDVEGDGLDHAGRGKHTDIAGI